MKEEALKLADELEKPVPVPNQPDMIYIDGHRMYGAQIIRRLVEELDKATYVLQPKICNKEAEEIYDDLCMSWQADMENGVKWLNEKAIEDFKKKYPELNKSISRTMQFLWAIAEGGKPQTKPTITKVDDKVVAVTMTDEEHRITEVLWEAPKPLSDEEIDNVAKNNFEGVGRLIYMISGNVKGNDFRQAVRSLAKAIEERHGIK